MPAFRRIQEEKHSGDTAHFVRTSTGYLAALVSIEKIRPHEETDPRHVAQLGRLVASERILRRPLAVAEQGYALLDGHHRLEILAGLGLHFAPCVMFCYGDPRIDVQSWRAGYRVTRELVLSYAARGRRMPNKTSRHIFSPDLGAIDVQLSRLAP